MFSSTQWLFLTMISIAIIVCWPVFPVWHRGSGGCNRTAQNGGLIDLVMSNQTCPRYFKVIHQDMAPWKDGITNEMLDDAKQKGASMRITIVSGKLYAQVYGHCPQSRQKFTVWGLLMLLKKFPGQVPDVDFMINCKDRPISRSQTRPAPVFSYCGTDQTHDILIPDYSYWGWPELNIDPWDKQASDIIRSSQQIEWENRRLSAFWKGNVRMGKLRKHLLQCNSNSVEIYDQDWSPMGFRNSKLTDQCKSRYNIYVDGAAWSASLKYRMACGSTLLYVSSDYYDFFSRALVPSYHYMPISSDTDTLCQSLEQAVRLGNQHPKEAEAIGRNGQSFVEKEVSMEHVYDYWFHLLSAYAKVQCFKPQVPRSGISLFSVAEVTTEAVHSSASSKAKSMFNNPQFTSTRYPCFMR